MPRRSLTHPRRVFWPSQMVFVWPNIWPRLCAEEVLSDDPAIRTYLPQTKNLSLLFYSSRLFYDSLQLEGPLARVGSSPIPFGCEYAKNYNSGLERRAPSCIR